MDLLSHQGQLELRVNRLAQYTDVIRHLKLSFTEILNDQQRLVPAFEFIDVNKHVPPP
jgi:hypothetical protein